MEAETQSNPDSRPTPPDCSLLEVRDFDHPIFYGWGLYMDGEYVSGGSVLWGIARRLGIRTERPDAWIKDEICKKILKQGRTMILPAIRIPAADFTKEI